MSDVGYTATDGSRAMRSMLPFSSLLEDAGMDMGSDLLDFDLPSDSGCV